MTDLDGTTVTVEHEGFSVTSTDSEASIRTALGMDAPPAVDEIPAELPAAEPPPEPIPSKEATPRDETGKFTKKDWQKRVDTLTWQTREAQRERDALRAELAAAKAPPAVAAPVPAAPVATPATFQTWEAWSATHPDHGYESYLDERADFRAAATVKSALEADRQARAQAETQTQVQTTIGRLRSLGNTAHDDFDTVMLGLANQQIQFSDALSGIIADELSGDTPLGHELAYYLGTHPDDLRRLNGLPPLTAAREAQKLIDRLTPASRGTGSEPPAVSQAHPPTRPIGAGHEAVIPPDPDDTEPVEKYIARMNAADRKAGRLR